MSNNQQGGTQHGPSEKRQGECVRERDGEKQSGGKIEGEGKAKYKNLAGVVGERKKKE